jgi:prepilin-type N-terminal cleavage/methylation domain-containing protein
MWYLVVAIIAAILGGFFLGTYNKPSVSTVIGITVLTIFSTLTFVRIWRPYQETNATTLLEAFLFYFPFTIARHIGMRFRPAAPTKRSASASAGFTALELMVVIGIVGILTAVSIPQFMAYQAREFNARVTDDVQKAVEAGWRYGLRNTSFFTGSCSDLPGFVPSEGVVCNTTAYSHSFVVIATHPRMSYKCGCAWDSEDPRVLCQ